MTTVTTLYPRTVTKLVATASQPARMLLASVAQAAAATSISKELAALHSVREPDGLPCSAVFLDVGSHVGNVVWDFFTRLNCYESCGGNSTCRPENWSSQSCKFCGSANAARQCGWMWPCELLDGIERLYLCMCA